MLNVETINKYLENNNLPPNEGYLLKDAGEGNFISEWDLQIPEPTTQQLDAITIIVEEARGWQDVDDLQNQMFEDKELLSRVFRYRREEALTGKTPKESASKMQEIYQYCDDVASANNPPYNTWELALARLDALDLPEE